jgi:hypothetical protein
LKLPVFRSTSVAMKDDAEDPRLVSRWALPTSLAVHLSIAALVIFGLPVSLLEPEEEQAINVDLVPPPKPPEEAKAKPPPPPPPPPQEKPEEPKQVEAEKQPPAQDDAAPQAPQPVISPVFQFGEKDAGPREARDGNSAEEDAASPQAEREPEKQEPKEPPPLTAARSENAVPLPDAAETPTPKPPADTAKKQETPKPEEAKKLFSQQATADVIATTAMGRLPRGVRAGRLCVTKLREQLRNSWPPYFPDLLPSYRLEEGTVIDVPKAAFRVNGEWYDLSYRCEVDTDATRVVAFAFRVGDLLPPSERQRRRLPSR